MLGTIQKAIRGGLAIALLVGVVGSAGAGGLAEDLPLRVDIRVERADLIVGEPVAINILVTNTGSAAVTVPTHLDGVGLLLRIESVGAGTTRSLTIDALSARKMVVDDVDLNPGLSLSRRIVLERNPSTGEFYFAEAGAYRVTVIVVPGYTSNEVDLSVRAPTGEDAAALAFLEASRRRLKALPRRSTEARLAWVEARDAEDRAFLERYGNTTYGNYRRLALARHLMADYGARRPAQVEEAVLLLQTVSDAQGFPLADEALYELGRCHDQQGRRQEAAAVRARLLLQYPDSPRAASLRGQQNVTQH